LATPVRGGDPRRASGDGLKPLRPKPAKGDVPEFCPLTAPAAPGLPDPIYSPPRKRPPIIFPMRCRNVDFPGVLAAKKDLLNPPRLLTRISSVHFACIWSGETASLLPCRAKCAHRSPPPSRPALRLRAFALSAPLVTPNLGASLERTKGTKVFASRPKKPWRSYGFL
jgi:hypothetical protein